MDIACGVGFREGFLTFGQKVKTPLEGPEPVQGEFFGFCSPDPNLSPRGEGL
jgi:hypothetical protein